jgi:hypothetical protein
MMRFTKTGGEISKQKRITRTGGYAINDRFGPHGNLLDALAPKHSVAP